MLFYSTAQYFVDANYAHTPMEQCAFFDVKAGVLKYKALGLYTMITDGLRHAYILLKGRSSMDNYRSVGQ